MLRKFVFGFVVVAFSVGVLAAADLNGRITKVDGDKITFEEGKKGEYKDAKVYTVAKDAKIMKGGKKGSEPTALSGGLTNEMFKTIGEKGIGATITTDDKGTVTAITVKGGKKKQQ
jgi:hypothetical protein